MGPLARSLDRRTFGRLAGAALLGCGLGGIAFAASQIAPDIASSLRYRDLAGTSRTASLGAPGPLSSEDTPHGEEGGVAVYSYDDGRDWSALLHVNPDCIGWVSLPQASIDHPVVQTGDNDSYMHRDFWGSYSLSGCPFLDYRDASAGNGAHSLVFGHHMTGTNTMFSAIFECHDQEVWDAMGLSGAAVTWSTPQGGARVYRPALGMLVREDYAPIQRFDADFEATDDELQQALASIAPLAASQERLESGELRKKGVYTEGQILQARMDLRRAKILQTAMELAGDASALSASWREDLEGAQSLLTLACCSSHLAGQPWRTLLVCAGPVAL